MIYILPIENLKERYSSWWSEYLPAKIKQFGKECEVIDGEIPIDYVDVGTVLSAAGTNHFKATQLQKICNKFFERKINPHSHFLICDLWFPGIEMIRYMSQMYQIPVHIWGAWHAGSCTSEDFAEPMHPWSRYFEVGFLNMCDGVFVGSEHSKQSIINRLLYFIPDEDAISIANKIYAFGMPLNFKELQKYSQEEKEKIILYPHRLDIEKKPDKFINIMQGLSLTWEEFNDYKIIFCTSKKKCIPQEIWVRALMANLIQYNKNVEIRENLTKEEYYTLLGKSSLVISTATEETFGYCIAEALSMGCQVLLPNDFSYPEIVEENPRCLYDSHDELLEKIPKILKNPVHPKELRDYVEPYERVLEKWIGLMQ